MTTTSTVAPAVKGVDRRHGASKLADQLQHCALATGVALTVTAATAPATWAAAVALGIGAVLYTLRPSVAHVALIIAAAAAIATLRLEPHIIPQTLTVAPVNAAPCAHACLPDTLTNPPPATWGVSGIGPCTNTETPHT